MNDKDKTQKQLSKEVAALRQRTTALEKALSKVNRALRALSECSEILVQATEEPGLLHDICRIIVDAGYRLAWVGFAEHDKEKTVRPVAQRGYEKGYLKTVNITWADTERGRGPTGKAIRTGKPSICKNTLTDPNYTPWCAEAIRRGYASSIALPLIDDGRVFGALNIYAVEPVAFYPEEVKLLAELANALAYGIMALRTHTEREQAEEALRTERDKAQHYLDIAEVILVALNKKGEITLINRKGNHILEYKEGELLGKNWLTTCLPAHVRKNVKGVFQKLMAGEEKITEFYENPVLTKSGTERIIAWHNAVLKDAQGTIIGTLSSGEDITERKQAEEALRSSLKAWQITFGAISDSVCLLDSEGRITRMNKATMQLLGKSENEIIGRLCWEVVHGMSKPIPECPIPRMKKTLQRESLVLPVGDRCFHITVDPVLDERGNLAGAVHSITDITERKQAEEELRESEARFRTLFEAIPDTVVVHDDEGTILHINEIGAQRLEWSAKDLVGRNLREIVTPENRLSIADHVRETHKVGWCMFETTFVSRSGWKIMAEVNERPIKFGKKKAILSVSRDITERKRAEEEIISLARFPSENPYPVLRLGQDGTILYANKASQLLLQDWGASAGSPAPLFWQEIVTQALGSQSKNIIEVACKEQVYSFVVAPIPDTGYVNLYGRDITDRKQAEETLRESEEQFRNLAEQSPNIIFINVKGRVVYANEKCTEITGYTQEELYAPDFDFMTLIAPESMDWVKELYNKHMQGEEVPPYEYTLITKEGKKIEAINATRLIQYGGERALLGVVTDITERKKAEEALQRSYQQLREMLITTVNALAATIAMRDPYTAGHQRRVTELACVIAEEMGLSEEQIEEIRLAATVHDIGKIIVPAEILNKPGRLSDIEFDIIKTHPQAAYDILKSVKFSGPVARIVQQHHERMDGSGYPQGLSGEDILLEARILAVADVVEAKSSHRPYRPAYSINEALEEISQNRGVLYDPEVVDACLRLFAEKGFTFKEG